MQRILVAFEVPFFRISGLGAVAPPLPAECLRPDAMARSEAPLCEGDRRSPLRLGVPHAWRRLQPRQRFPRLPLRCPTSKGFLLVSAPGAAAKGGVLQLTMETITKARAPSLSHRLHRMTWCRRPHLSASHQVFSHSLLPDADSSLTGFRTVDCPQRLRVDDAFWSDQEDDNDWVDPWRTQLSSSASRHATLVSPLYAGRNRPQSSWNSRPVALLVLLLVLISAAGERLTSSRSSHRTLVLYVARIRVPAHLNRPWHIICISESAGFVTGSSFAENVHVATQHHCAVPLDNDTFARDFTCTSIHVPCSRRFSS